MAAGIARCASRRRPSRQHPVNPVASFPAHAPGESEADMTKSHTCGRAARIALVLMAGASLTACVTPRYPSRADGVATPPPAGQGEYKVGKPYQVGGVWYVPREQPNYDQRGVASWYGDQFHMKATANGETF